MRACPISVSSFLWVIGFCVFAAGVGAAPQSASIPPSTISGAGYRIAGTVVSKADRRPLSRTRITVTNVKDSHQLKSMITSEDGKFEFGGLPAGKYSLAGAKRGFISAAYDQHEQYSTAIVTGAGLDTEALVLRLAPDAVIAGKVLDEVGEPVRHAVVTLYYEDHSSGVGQIRQGRTAQTDDLGEYELTPLRPGTYFLSASGRPWYAVHPRSEPTHSKSNQQTEPQATADRSLDVAYPVTYYPDVVDVESALPIPIRGGEQVQADFHLNPVPSLRLLFRLTDAGNGYFVPQLRQPAFDDYTSLQTGGTRFVSPGLVEVTGVPAGRYDVHLSGPGQSLQMDGVDLTKDGEEIDTSKAGAVASVKFSMRVPGEAVLPPSLTVGLRSGARVVGVAQPVDSKGEAELQQIASGRYEVAVWGGERTYSISRISAEGAEITGHTLTVAAGSSPSVSLVLVSGSVEVRGTVTRAGKGFAGAMVVLLPKNPELDRDLFRRDQSDLDGTFALRDVVPGSYTLLAIDNGWELDWARPGVIAAYMKGGRRVEVGNQEGRPMNVTESIEAQSR